ncbi:MAG: hypothetical protein HOK81_15645 [Rhodospirillaceae bacterium]|nr:hypothetical protein [Rhodospirillaceae bacterium]
MPPMDLPATELPNDANGGAEEPDSIQSQLEALARAAESGRFRPDATPQPASPTPPPPPDPTPLEAEAEPEEPATAPRIEEPSADFEDGFSDPGLRDRAPSDDLSFAPESPYDDTLEADHADETAEDGPSADDKAVAEALDALANRVGTSENNIDEILSPLEQAVRSLEHQLETIEHSDGKTSGQPDAPAAPPIERHATEAPAQDSDQTRVPDPTQRGRDRETAPMPGFGESATGGERATEAPARDRDPHGRDKARETATDLLATLETMNARMEEGEQERSATPPVEADSSRTPRPLRSDVPLGPSGATDEPRTTPEPPRPLSGETLDPIAPLRSAAGRETDGDDATVLDLDNRVDDDQEVRAGMAAGSSAPQQPSASGAEADNGRRVDWFEPIEERPERFERTGSTMRVLRAVILIVALAGVLAIAAWFYLRGDDTAGLIGEIERLAANPGAIFERGTPPGNMAEPAPTRQAEMSKETPPAPAGEPAPTDRTKADATATPAPPSNPTMAPSPTMAPAVAPPPPPAPQAAPQTASRPPETDDLEERIAWLKGAAQRGDSNAQHDLAALYAQGTGVEQDYRSASHWFREAAVQGIANAQYNLGVLHERGLGVQQDPLEALLWYLSAAEQGHAAAQYNVGVAYAEGKGIPQNYPEAIKWFEKSALQGLTRAQYNLGIMMEDGLGRTPDLVQAARWYTIAARRGEADAQARYDEIVAQLSAEELAEVDRLVAESVIAADAPPSPIQAAGVSGAGAASQDAVAPPPPARPKTAMVDRSVIAEVQLLLNRLNFDSGPADGVMGDKTRYAIREYQTTMGLDVTGEPSAVLLTHLREVAGP